MAQVAPHSPGNPHQQQPADPDQDGTGEDVCRQHPCRHDAESDQKSEALPPRADQGEDATSTTMGLRVVIPSLRGIPRRRRYSSHASQIPASPGDVSSPPLTPPQTGSGTVARHDGVVSWCARWRPLSPRDLQHGIAPRRTICLYGRARVPSPLVDDLVARALALPPPDMAPITTRFHKGQASSCHL